ncbi:MAG: hypothetical protein JJ974_01585 [Phycisphaerales bacterium]|nr:hypothetical protein [Phycisphaerales bacterium]
MNTATAILGTLAFTVGSALGTVTVSQGSSGTTYGTTLNFDEVSGPTGPGIANNAWAGIGLADMSSGDGNNVVDDFVEPWIGTDNAFFGNFGVFMTFDSDLTNFSAQVWDPSGPPGPIGGGVGIFVFNDGAEVANSFITASWGGVGDEWIDVSADGGMVFDEIRIVGFGFSPTTYVDNLSWNAVPAPSGLAALGMIGLATTRRRRA